MNKIFADHVTQTAFFLSISKKQIGFLQHLLNFPWPKLEYYDRDYYCKGTLHNPDSWLASFGALKRKGLVAWVVDNEELGRGHYELTTAGKLTCELLIEAGLIEMKTTEMACA